LAGIALIVAGVMAPAPFLASYLGSVLAIDPYVSEGLLATGVVAVLVGIYLIFAVAPKPAPVSRLTRPGLLSLVWTDLRGRGFRTFTSGSAVAVVVGTLFLSTLLTTGGAYSVEVLRNRFGADIVVMPDDATLSSQTFYTHLYTPGASYMDQSVEAQIAAIPGVQATAPQLYITRIAASGGCGGVGYKWIVGIDPERDFTVVNSLPQPLPALLGPREAIKGWEVPAFERAVDKGKYYDVQLELVGTLERTGTYMDHIMFVSMETGYEMLRSHRTMLLTKPDVLHALGLQPPGFKEGEISSVFVKLAPGADADEVSEAIAASVSGTQAIPFATLVDSAKTRLLGLLSTFSLAGTMVFGASLLLVSTTTALGTNERRGEIGILRALGAARRFIARVVTVQTILVTSIAGLLGILGAWMVLYILYVPIIASLGIPHLMPDVPQLVTLAGWALGLAAVTGAVAASWPAFAASRIDPYEAVRRGAK
jgi:putative ABC transport system permease protein